MGTDATKTAKLLWRAAERLKETSAAEALEHIVWPAECDARSASGIPPLISSDLTKELLTGVTGTQSFPSLSTTVIHEPIYGDVLLGAQVLSASPEELEEYEVTPEERARWEWRYFIEGEWQVLPPYISGVLETALRSS